MRVRARLALDHSRPSYWLAIALRGQPLSAALPSPASAARWRGLALVLDRNRLTRTAAERGPVLSGACGQVGVFGGTWSSRRW